MAQDEVNLEGGCTCGEVRYRMTMPPLVVHCCHCRFCQRQTGASFALNALIEAEHVETTKGSPEKVMVDSPSGKGQQIVRCPTCRVAVWSNYWFSGLFEIVNFIRVGTLDDPDQLPPDVHIFTSTKQPWVVIPDGHKHVDEYYVTDETWSADSLVRRDALVELLEQQ